MRINHNMPALQSAANIARASKGTSTAMRRLSTGYRINSSKDDPAGMSISNRVGMQISGTQQAVQNSMNGISIVQTAEGGLQEIHNMLQRLRELTLQANNDTTVPADRELIHMEINQLSRAVTGMAIGTRFNGISLLSQTNIKYSATDKDGNIVKDSNGDVVLNTEEPIVLIQIGADMNMQLRMTLVDARASFLGDNDLRLDKIGSMPEGRDEFVKDGAEGTQYRNSVLVALETAVDQISRMRSTFGSYQNRLESTVTSLSTMDENLQGARMRIRDADMAAEATELSIARVIEQSGLAILAQANMRPQQILQLLS
jgi:flagellin